MKRKTKLKNYPNEKDDSMKLFLNLPALERLIGGDSEVEISLRHQIVNEFTKRSLTEIAKSQSYQKTLQELRNILDDEVKNTVGITLKNGYRSSHSDQLREQIQSIIQKAVDEAIDKSIQTAIKNKMDYYESKTFEQVIENKVGYAFNVKIDQLVKAEVERRMKLALEAK